MWGDRFAVACAVLLALYCVLFAVAGFAFAVSSIVSPPKAQAMEFLLNPRDRPVLESVPQVWQARTTGISEFDFDGVHYIVVNLPKHYVDYSSWYVRMP